MNSRSLWLISRVPSVSSLFPTFGKSPGHPGHVSGGASSVYGSGGPGSSGLLSQSAQRHGPGVALCSRRRISVSRFRMPFMRLVYILHSYDACIAAQHATDGVIGLDTHSLGSSDLALILLVETRSGNQFRACIRYASKSPLGW